MAKNPAPARLDKQQAARFLNISVRQLQRLMSARRIAYTVVPTTYGPQAIFERTELGRVREERRAGVQRPRLLPLTPDTAAEASGADIAVTPSRTALARREQAAPILEHLAALLAEPRRGAAVDVVHKFWLTRREAINLSGLPVGVVDAALKAGKLGVKSGGRWLIQRTALENFAARWKPS
jgi:hypothetical protein